MKKQGQIALGLLKDPVITLLLCGILGFMTACPRDNPKPPAKEPESTRSAPPDTAPYVREAIPEDYAPGGKKAIPPEVTTKPPTKEPTPLEKGIPPEKKPGKEK
jgi:hypothetical protein